MHDHSLIALQTHRALMQVIGNVRDAIKERVNRSQLVHG